MMAALFMHSRGRRQAIVSFVTEVIPSRNSTKWNCTPNFDLEDRTSSIQRTRLRTTSAAFFFFLFSSFFLLLFFIFAVNEGVTAENNAPPSTNSSWSSRCISSKYQSLFCISSHQSPLFCAKFSGRKCFSTSHACAIREDTRGFRRLSIVCWNSYSARLPYRIEIGNTARIATPV